METLDYTQHYNKSGSLLRDEESLPVDRVKKLVELAEGDIAFLEEMIVSCIEDLEELCHRFTVAMEQKDEARLTLIAHKAKTLIHLLELQEVEQLLNQSKVLVNDTITNGQQIESLINQMTTLSGIVQQSLSESLS